MRVVLLIVFIFAPSFAWSCSCSAPRLIEKIENSESIIIGNIVQVKSLEYFDEVAKYEGPGVQLVVQIEETLKGKDEKEVVLYSTFGGGECGVTTEIPTKYVFFLDDDIVSACDGHILYQNFDKKGFMEEVSEIKRLVGSGI
jgi:hypothetical protein